MGTDSVPGAGRGLQAAGVVLFAEASVFLLATMLGEAIAPGYSMNTATISDLGATPATADLFNGAMIVVGICNLVGAILIRRWHRRWFATAAFVLAGAGAIGVGFVNVGINSDVHGIFALASFLGFNLQAIAVAGRLPRLLGRISWVAGVAGLVAMAVLLIGEFGNAAIYGALGIGGVERLVVYPPTLWMLAFGGALITICARLRPA